MEKTQEKQLSRYAKNREHLKAVSRKVKTAAKEGGLSINQALKQFVYDPESALTFDSYKGWQSKGFQVKRGEKAYLFWSKPIQAQKTDKQENGEDEFEYFPLAYLFSNEQVHQPKE